MVAVLAKQLDVVNGDEIQRQPFYTGDLAHVRLQHNTQVRERRAWKDIEVQIIASAR